MTTLRQITLPLSFSTRLKNQGVEIFKSFLKFIKTGGGGAGTGSRALETTLSLGCEPWFQRHGGQAGQRCECSGWGDVEPAGPLSGLCLGPSMGLRAAPPPPLCQSRALKALSRRTAVLPQLRSLVWCRDPVGTKPGQLRGFIPIPFLLLSKSESSPEHAGRRRRQQWRLGR